MKLIIRDEKPKEDVCEIWLEEHNGRIHVKSRSTGGLEKAEVVFYPDDSARPIKNGRFKWETE